ncbi:MAG: hypothetical protein IPH18_18040 [Chitinophagaceae bacterium]|nr:hypothetical protein [Chitinophagaceae bacterium]
MLDSPVNKIYPYFRTHGHNCKSNYEDANLLADIGRIGFVESHGHSAPQQILMCMLLPNTPPDHTATGTQRPGNIYHILY